MEPFLALSGTALAAGGLLATAGWLLFAVFDPSHTDHASRRYLPINALLIAGGVFMALGLPGFYANQAQAGGTFGRIAFVIFYIGITIPYIGVQSIESATMPEVPARMRRWVSVGAPALFIGSLLFGISSLLAGVYPPWFGAGLIVAALLGPLTTVRTLPLLFRHNLLPALFTALMAAAGFLLLF